MYVIRVEIPFVLQEQLKCWLHNMIYLATVALQESR